MGQDLVVIGLGYVGLPLAQAAVRAGLSVAGLDLDEEKVAGLHAGRSHVDDVGDAEVQELLDAGFRATSDAAVLRTAAAASICRPPRSRTRPRQARSPRRRCPAAGRRGVLPVPAEQRWFWTEPAGGEWVHATCSRILEGRALAATHETFRAKASRMPCPMSSFSDTIPHVGVS